MDVFIFTAFSIEISVSKQCRSYQMPHLAASELGLQCLHNAPKWVSGLKRVKLGNSFEYFSIDLLHMNISVLTCFTMKVYKA